jgi:hypothetical protein
MNYVLVIAGILLLLTGNDLLYIRTPAEFLTPLGYIGYDILKIWNATSAEQLQVSGVFLLIIGVIVIIIGSYATSSSRHF